MIHAWDLPTSSQMSLFGRSFDPREVILEYQGPQLVALERGGRQFLGLAVDENGEVERWLESPISKLELESLKCGFSSLRMAILKETISVVDYSHETGEVVHEWEVDSPRIPDTAVPKPGVLIPSSAQRHFLSERSQAESGLFRFDGESVKDHRMPIGAFSQLASKVQELWSAIGDSHGIGVGALEIAGVGAGSLSMLVHSRNWGAFGEIAKHYQSLTLASDDATALDRVLSSEAPRVGTVYRAYLKLLQNQRVEVLAQARDSASFVGYQSAGRTLEGLMALTAETLAVPEADTATFRGYFVEFWSQGRAPKFHFHNLDTGDKYIGKIDKGLRKRIKDDMHARAFRLTLGDPSRVYRATLRIEMTEPSPKYTLLDYQLSSGRTA